MHRTPRATAPQALNDMVLEATQASIPPGLLALLQAAGKPVRSGVSAGKVGRAQKSTQRGRPVGIFAGKPGGGARPNSSKRCEPQRLGSAFAGMRSPAPVRRLLRIHACSSGSRTSA